MSDRDEIWIPIRNFPIYDCSNFGRIRNSKTGRIMRQSINTRGYLQVTLRRNNRYYTLRVHRLVASAFHPTSNMDELDVNHIDGNKLNNDADNLEWCTRSENIRHGIRIGLIHTNNYGRKRRPVRVVETGEEFESIRECSKTINADPSEISQYLNGKTRSVEGYHFEEI